MLNFFSKILDSNEKQVNKLQPIVEAINSFEPKLSKLSDSKLKAKTAEFKLRLERSETLDDILPEAFAAVREASKRVLGQRHYDVQLLGGIVLHQGKIAEQKTGEGKTLTASLPLYLNSLTGKGVHLATVNDYLARVGLGWMGPIYEALGVTAGVVMQDAAYIYDQKYEDKKQADWRLRHLRSVEKKEAYAADITYGTNNEFGFDYLRDNMVWELKDMAQRAPHFAIVDEADSILIDEARTPLIISSPASKANEKYSQFARLVEELSQTTDYVMDEKLKTANLTEAGIAKVESKLGVTNLYEKDFASIHHIQQALRAKSLFHKDKDYVVKEGEIIIVDEFTGRLMPGRRWSEGLHQAIEAKEGVSIQQESQTLATISFQNYFRLYEKLAGMTGTAVTEAEEFHKIYNLEVIIIPTNKPLIRKDHADVVYKTIKAKFAAIAKEVEKQHEDGRPVLIGTTSIEKNEALSALLKKSKIPHFTLNAKNHEREAEIIAQAGQKGTVTLATNIAGRGVDIILGGPPPTDKLGRPEQKGKNYEKWQKAHDELVALGGLLVIGSERHEARRIDNQLRGRAGRQGDPGASHFFVSLEDDLMRIFGGEQIAKIMTAFKLPEDTPIEHGMVSKAIENAQVKVETHNFDIRKHLVEYDDIANKQREIIYGMRKALLVAGQSNENATQVSSDVKEKIDREIETLVLAKSEERISDTDLQSIVKEYATIVPFDEKSQSAFTQDAKSKKSPQELIDFLKSVAGSVYESRVKQLGEKVSRDIEKFVSLSVIDTLWIEHLDALDDLREGIGLRAAGQRDPLVEYKQEAFNLFEKLTGSIDYEIVHRIFKVHVHQEGQQELPQQEVHVDPLQNEFKEEVVQKEAEIDPAQMSDEELDAEIARLEAQERGSTIGAENPYQGALSTKTIKVEKIGRNDPCPCGAINPQTGKVYKYKKCGLINASYHKG